MGVKSSLIKFLNQLPYVRGLYKENQQLKRLAMYPPGHFYSTIVDPNHILKFEAKIWDAAAHSREIAGVDLQPDKQVTLLEKLASYYPELPFQDNKVQDLRFYYRNDFFTHTDAIVLYSLMRHLKPRRIIEIGSGFSSAVMLDTNELFFSNQIKLTFIEPYADRLASLLKPSDQKAVSIIEHDVQQVDLSVFDELESGDFLFVDSTHVVKTASDVNFIIFQILPRLKRGVWIHFHDVFYPFEYPKRWVLEGRNWNEDYFLRAFLMYNSGFVVRLFPDFLYRHHTKAFEKMPLCVGGGSLWIEKV